MIVPCSGGCFICLSHKIERANNQTSINRSEMNYMQVEIESDSEPIDKLLTDEEHTNKLKNLAKFISLHADVLTKCNEA